MKLYQSALALSVTISATLSALGCGSAGSDDSLGAVQQRSDADFQYVSMGQPVSPLKPRIAKIKVQNQTSMAMTVKVVALHLPELANMELPFAKATTATTVTSAIFLPPATNGTVAMSPVQNIENKGQGSFTVGAGQPCMSQMKPRTITVFFQTRDMMKATTVAAWRSQADPSELHIFLVPRPTTPTTGNSFDFEVASDVGALDFQSADGGPISDTTPPSAEGTSDSGTSVPPTTPDGDAGTVCCACMVPEDTGI